MYTLAQSRQTLQPRTHLDNRQLRVSRHRRREVVRRVPEHTVADLVDLPRPDERDVADNGGLHQVPPTIELARFLLVARDLHARLEPALVVSNRNRAVLDRRRGTGGREEGRDTCRVRPQTADKRALRDQL